jgi:hypothetical protein
MVIRKGFGIDPLTALQLGTTALNLLGGNDTAAKEAVAAQASARQAWLIGGALAAGAAVLAVVFLRRP